MRVLILGGTVFLGRHLVDAALARGAVVTLFHRGHNACHRPDEVEQVLGDRRTDLALLTEREFDVVVDTSGYLPAEVRDSATAVRAGHYTFVSSGSAYADASTRPLAEDEELHESPPPGERRVHGEFYGPQKAGCERALREVRRDSSLILRAGLLVGPNDPTDRFTYWALRMREPGPALAPAVPDQPVQFLDARDLASWILQAATDGVTGVMNVNGPRARWTFGALLAAIGDTEIHWVDEHLLLDAGVQPWTELPLWLPEQFGATGLLDMAVDRAELCGLRARPLADTVRDTVRWAADRSVGFAADYGTRAHSMVLSRAREADLLARFDVAAPR